MNLSQAYRQFGGAQRKYKGEEGTAKMWGEGTKMVGDALQFIGEAAAPQVEAWQDFEAGQKSVGITGEDIQGPANLWQRATKTPSEIMSGNVTAGGRSYDAASLQMMGTIKSNRDSLGVAAIHASSGGKPLEEIYGKKIEEADSSSAMTREPTMWEKAISNFKEREEWGGKREKDPQGMSIHYEDDKPITSSAKPVKTNVPSVVTDKDEPKIDIKVEKLDNPSAEKEMISFGSGVQNKDFEKHLRKTYGFTGTGLTSMIKAKTGQDWSKMSPEERDEFAKSYKYMGMSE